MSSPPLPRGDTRPMIDGTIAFRWAIVESSMRHPAPWRGDLVLLAYVQDILFTYQTRSPHRAADQGAISSRDGTSRTPAASMRANARGRISRRFLGAAMAKLPHDLVDRPVAPRILNLTGLLLVPLRTIEPILEDSHFQVRKLREVQ